jgi:malate dehydrogenase (oxaloacetate-decarboxylating)
MVDDIQGTGAVTQAAVKSAVWAAKGKVAEQKIVIFGAGTAGTGIIPLHMQRLRYVGIADQLRDMIALEGKSKEEATKQIWYLSLPPDEFDLTLICCIGWLINLVF